MFVERSKEALASLAANVESLGFGRRARVFSVPVERAARALGGERFDLVFADPPYADVKSGVAIRALESVAVPRLDVRGLLVLEHASRDSPPAIGGMKHEELRVYGDTAISFYVPHAATAE